MKKRQDTNDIPICNTCSDAAARGHMEAIGAIAAVGDKRTEEEMGDNFVHHLHKRISEPVLGVNEEILPGVFTLTVLPYC